MESVQSVDGEDRKHGGAIKKAISSVVRRVSALGVSATRRGSAKPVIAGAGSSDTGSDARHRSSSRQSWNPEAFEAASEMAALHNLRVNPGALAHSKLYGGHDADADFEWSMDDDVILPVHTVSQSGMSVPSNGYMAETGVVPTIARLGLADPRRNSARLRTPEGKQQAPPNNGDYFDYGNNNHNNNITPKGSHMSLTSKSRPSSMRSSHQDFHDLVASIPVSSIPITITPAEAARTPRASLIPVVMTSELPVPKGSRHSLLARPPSRRISSSMYTDASLHSSSMAASVGSNFTPPVAPRDRRRSGMPDAFAVPVQTLAMLGGSPDELAATDAHAEIIQGDPKFEPYRDMLKSGATEIEVADAMAFFGVDHVAFFGRNILEEAGVANQPSEERQRENRMWIEKRKLEQDNDKKGEVATDPVAPYPPHNKDEDNMEIEQKETFSSIEAESDTYKELRQTQERLSNLGVIPVSSLLPATIPTNESASTIAVNDDVEAKQAEADLLQRYREAHREQMEREKQERETKEREKQRTEAEQAAKLEAIIQANKEQVKLEQEKQEQAKLKEAEALAKFNEATKAERELLKQREEESKAAETQLAAETFAKYKELQQKQEEEETKVRLAREEERKKQDLLRRSKEDEQSRLQAEAQRELEAAAKKREDVDDLKKHVSVSSQQQQQQEEQQRTAQRESQRGVEQQQQAKLVEQQKRHREEEELRLKALEERIEKERNRTSLTTTAVAASPPPLPPTRPQQEQSTLEEDRKAGSNASSITTKHVQEPVAVVAGSIGEMEGNLLKKTKGGQWHTRAFTLRNKELSWVRSDQKTINKLVLTPDSQVRDVPVGLKKFMFEVSVPGSSPLMLSAAGIREKSEWIRCIQYAITGVMPSSSSTADQPHRRTSLTLLQGKRLTTEGAIFAAARASAAGGPLPVPPSSRPKSIRSANSNGGSTTSSTAPTASPPASSSALKSTTQVAATANEKFVEKLNKFAKSPQTVCSACGETVYKMEEVSLKHKVVLHRRCFVCAHCKRQLTLSNFVQHTDNKTYCQNHYNELFLGDNATVLSGGRPTSSGTSTTTATASVAVSAKAAAVLPEIARVKESNGAASVGSEAPSTPKKLASRLDPALLSSMLLPKKPSLLRMAGGGGSGMLAVRSGPGSGATSGAAAIDNSAALSKPIVPRGRRRQPSMLPTSLAKSQLGTEPVDRMTSECTFKILIDPSDSSNVLWMHATSRPERDHWINCLCNVVQALEMQRTLEDAQKVDMISALQAQTDLEDFLTKNEIAYSGYCEKLSMKSRRNWKRRWFELSEVGEIKYSEDESKRIKKTIQLTHRSIVLDAHDNRLSGPLAVRSTS